MIADISPINELISNVVTITAISAGTAPITNAFRIGTSPRTFRAAICPVMLRNNANDATVPAIRIGLAVTCRVEITNAPNPSN
jgi:hypothetical protein